ncbi:hypothetical protein DPMN_046889 [Dreissena polymorpha]|uniref:Uncharacterized protein n=1 Tax=Dreissena polymorpha TaxID=45954 RepID=A0A9D4D7Q7_DREPO|nr:hypothetical protein DPMN_046889 [Dreissena polymorpha]
MPRNKRNKQHHTTRKERKAGKTAPQMAGYSTDEHEFSVRLSLALDYLAINEHVIKFRKERMFSYERDITLVQQAFGRNIRTYIFGSQIEGTATIGMMSDKVRLFSCMITKSFLRLQNDTVLQKVSGIQTLYTRVSVKVFLSNASSFSKGLAPVTGLQRRH